jgi:hypothetical protein
MGQSIFVFLHHVFLLPGTPCFRSLPRPFFRILLLLDFPLRGYLHCDIRLCLLVLSTSGERPLLLLYASSLSVNLLATSISLDTVFGLVLPISSTRSERRRPLEKASIALSSETSSAEFLITLQHYI